MAILIPRGGGLVLLGALTLGVTIVRLSLPLFWLKREFPEFALRRSYVTRERVRNLASVSSSNFLVHIAGKVVFSTDVVVVGIVLGALAATHYALPARLFALAFGLCSVGANLLFPAFAEHEGSGDVVRQRRLLLIGLRGSIAAALVLALPLLLIPDLLIEGWVGEGYGESSPVLALLAVVVLIHQPIYLLTQYLIARGRQQRTARALIVAVTINVVLSVTFAETIGLWGVALATLVTDLGVLPTWCRCSLLLRRGFRCRRSCGRRCGRWCRRLARRSSFSCSSRGPSSRTRCSSCSRSGSAGWPRPAC